jgi:hypothetical protein
MCICGNVQWNPLYNYYIQIKMFLKKRCSLLLGNSKSTEWYDIGRYVSLGIKVDSEYPLLLWTATHIGQSFDLWQLSGTTLQWQKQTLSCQRTDVVSHIKWASVLLITGCSITLLTKALQTSEAVKASKQHFVHKQNSHLWTCDSALYSDLEIHIPLTNIEIKSF